MHSLNEEQRRRLVVQYKIDHPELSNNAVAKYFAELGVARSTVYGILDRYSEAGEAAVLRKEGSGRPATKVTDSLKETMASDAKRGLSQREIARKFDISQPYVNEILKKQGLSAFKKEKVAAASPEQKERQRVRIDRLYREVLKGDDGSLDIIMDDESYFTLSCNNIPGNRYYYATARGDAPDEIRFSQSKKFEDKVLVWLAISKKGISKVFFCHASSMNKEIYASQCIRKRLLPFIEELHSDGNYLFWPDLASCHYAHDVIDTFVETGINFVHKDLNPPNVPQLRPIEDFWGMLKQKVYHHNWQAATVQQLENRIRYCLRQVDLPCVQAMMANVKSLIRRARADGVASIQH